MKSEKNPYLKQMKQKEINPNLKKKRTENQAK